MTKRTKTGQRKHDQAVLNSANWYEGKGFKVKADLPGWEKPKTMGGFRPDMIAKKGKKEVVLEVETKKSLGKDKKQCEAFTEYTDRKGPREFKKKIV